MSTCDSGASASNTSRILLPREKGAAERELRSFFGVSREAEGRNGFGGEGRSGPTTATGRSDEP